MRFAILFLLSCLSCSAQTIVGKSRVVGNATVLASGSGGITAGDGIVCEVQGLITSVSAATVSDTLNGAFTGVGGSASSGIGTNTAIYYFLNSAHDSSDTITFTATSSSQFSTMSCQAFKNIAASGALDSNTNNPGNLGPLTGTNPSSGNFTTSANGQLVLGFLQNTASTIATGSACTIIDRITAEGAFPCYFVQTTASSTTQLNWNDSSDTWIMSWASFASNGSAIVLDGTCHASHDNGATNSITVVVTISC